MKKITVFIVLAMVLCIPGIQVMGENSTWGTNYTVGQVEYGNTQDIEFVSEEIYIKNSIITALFVFRNRSDKNTAIDFYFPLLGEVKLSDNSNYPKITDEEEFIKDLYNFSSFINGKKTGVKLEKIKSVQAKGKEVPAFSIRYSFAPGEEIGISTVFNNVAVKTVFSYDTDKTTGNSKGKKIVSWDLFYEYGMQWGPGSGYRIGNLKIYWESNMPRKLGSFLSFEFPDSSLANVRLFSEGYHLFEDFQSIEYKNGSNWFFWEYKNIEPDFNVSLNYFHKFDGSMKLAELLGSKKIFGNTESALKFIEDWITKLGIFSVFVKNGDYKFDRDNTKEITEFCLNLNYALAGYGIQSKGYEKKINIFKWYEQKKKWIDESVFISNLHFLLCYQEKFAEWEKSGLWK